MRTTRSLAVLAVVCALLVVRPPEIAARQQPLPSNPTFRAGVNLVTVDVVVRDRKTGRLATGLTRKDFEIEDDGRRQAIATFAAVNLPQRRAAVTATTRTPPSRAPLGAVATNQHPEGRLIVFFIDDSTIPFGETAYLRDWLYRYVDHHMADNDQVAVWTVTDMLPRQGFTSDRTRLDAVIGRIQGDDGVFRPSPDYALDALHRLVDRLGRISDRRKALIYFGRLNITLHCPNCARTPEYEQLYRQILQEAAAANVAVYPVSVTGVAGFDDVVSGGSAVAATFTRRLPIPLEELAKETGGFYADRNDFGAVLQEVEGEAGTYYLLGFSPSTIDPKPGDFRHLRVTVNRPGLTVRARSGYIQVPTLHGYQPALVPSPIGEVADGPIPVTGLPLRIRAASFRRGTKDHTVLVTLRTIAPTARPGETVRYALVGLDDHARVTTRTQGTSVVPRGGTSRGITVVSTLHLKPGLCTIKAAVRTEKGRVGSVFLDLDVPNVRARGSARKN